MNRLIIIPLLCITAALQAQPEIKPQANATVPAPSLGIAAQPAAYSTVPNNFVRVYEPTSPQTSVAALPNATVADVKTTTAYVDGLGRPLQTVAKQISPTQKDMVTANVYDAFGREIYKYLPYVAPDGTGSFRNNPFVQQAQYYQPLYDASGNGEKVYYGKTEMEASPLNRATKSMPPGNSWAGSGRGISSWAYTNSSTDDAVQIWSIGMAVGSVPSTNSTYAAGELLKNVTIDEHGNQTIEYKDKEGQLILKKVQQGNGTANTTANWIYTYYVYDDLNRLRWVLQPRAVEQIFGTWNISTDIGNELCFKYEYDLRGRMIIKKVPGAGEVRMVYDGRDRLVLTQDANLHQQGKWLYTMYDDLNRPTATGLWVNTTDRATHQAAAYYSSSYPTLNGTYEELTRTYYDNYTGIMAASGLSSSLDATSVSNGGFFTSYNTAPQYAQAITAGNNTLGLTTGTKVKLLGTSTYLYTLTIYDVKKRPIQVKSTNASGGSDVGTMQYDWAGKVLKSYQKHAKAGTNAATHHVKTTTEYDHASRATKIWKNISTGTSPSGTDQLISDNVYDEMGQLKTKKLGTNPSNTSLPLETLDYAYNLRGWMNGINKDYAEGFNNSNWFGMVLNYDFGFTMAAMPGGTASAYGLYNGNISGWKWRAKGDGEQRAYGFEYDKLNRISYADFNQLNPSAGAGVWNKTIASTSNTIDFSMGGTSNNRMHYDANGNIMSMVQKGLKVNNSSTIDQLTYNYQANSNKLTKVTDLSGSAGLGDFKDGSNSNDDYSYDLNGNMNIDNNKNIASIAYNHLNLPQTITVTGKGTIGYVYDATGNKISKTVNESGQSAKTTLYMGGFVYENDVVQFTGHEEGRARYDNNQWQYDYFLKDHLGNIRTVLTQQQKTDIYPAATLEGTTTSGALSVEKDYYTVNTAQVETKTFSPAHYNNNIGTTSTPTIPNPNPQGNAAALSTKMYKLSSTTQKTGLGITLKVMSGDNVNIYGRSQFTSTTGGITNSNNTVLGILGTLLTTPSNLGSQKGISATDINTGINSSSINSLITSQSNGTGTNPKAGVCWILFDEQMNYANAGFVRNNNGSGNVLTPYNINVPVTKSGYLYVFCSNESSLSVWFDNLQLVHNRGALLEENVYYPFGLVMQGISSKALSYAIENKKGYNGNELQSNEWQDKTGLDFYDFNARTYDQQIGRFQRIDDLSDFDFNSSPYTYSNNNPILLNDPTGLLSDSANPVKHEPVNVVVKTKKLQGGLYDGKYYTKIEVGSYSKNGYSTFKSKKYIPHEEVAKTLKAFIHDYNALAKLYSIGATLAGGSVLDLKSVEDYKKAFKKLKDVLREGKLKISIKSPAMLVLGTIMGIRADQLNNQAANVLDVLIKYIETNQDKPSEMRGIYYLHDSYYVGCMGGSGGSSTQAFYDVASKKYLGGTYEHY